MKDYRTMLTTLLFAFALAACDSTAAERVTNVDAQATAQIDQYTRDAISTQTTRELEVEKIVREMQATDDSMAATAAAINATVTAAAEVAATETQAASVLATQTFNAGKTATAVLEVGATQTAQVVGTQTTLALVAQDAEVKRAQWTSDLLWVLRFMAGAAGIVILAVAAFVGIRILRKQGSVVRYGPNGNPLIIHDNGKGQTSVINPMVPIPVMHMDGNGNAISPLADLSSEMIAQLAAGWLYVLAQQAQHNPYRPVKPEPPIERENSWQLGPVKHATHTKPMLPSSPASGNHALPAPSHYTEQALSAPVMRLPTWSEFVSWRWESKQLPIGANESGVMAIDPDGDPHILIAGTTGSGKTRHGLAVLAAGALRLGWHVVVLNRAGSDFAALAAHPAMHIFDGHEWPPQILTATAEEVDRRSVMLRERGLSTWHGLEGLEPRVMIIVDELVALTQSQTAPEAVRRMWAAIVHITSAGRKCGVHLVYATTDPTYKTLGRFGLVARDNSARVAFRLRAGQSIMAGGTALDLPPRRFLALMSSQNEPLSGAAFAPSDDELTTFADSISPSASPQPPMFILQPDQVSTPAPVNQLTERVTAEVEANPTISKRKLCLAVLGKEYQGAHAGELDRALASGGWRKVDGEWKRATTAIESA